MRHETLVSKVQKWDVFQGSVLLEGYQDTTIYTVY